MNHHEHYKRRSAGFRNANEGRLARVGRHEEQRRLNRAENVARHRELTGDVEREAASSRRGDRGTRLRKWQEEQRLKKKIEEQKKKPIFKVGIVHHKVYSPPFSDRFTKKQQPDNSRGGNRVFTKSFAPPNYVFTVPSGVMEIPMFSRIAGASPNKAGWTQMMKARLEWQTAVVPLRRASSSSVSNRNSTSDFRRCSTSRDESTEEANAEDNSSSEVANFVDRQVAQVFNGRTSSPRSGTPVPRPCSRFVLTSCGKDSARKEPSNRMRNRASSADEIPKTAKENNSSEFSGNESCAPKSSRKVDFNDDILLEKVPAVVVAQALINSNADLGRALPRTCSYDANDNFVEPYDMRNVTVRTVKKRLDFENESFDECENTMPESTVIPNVIVTTPTPVKGPIKNTPSKHNRSNVLKEHRWIGSEDRSRVGINEPRSHTVNSPPCVIIAEPLTSNDYYTSTC